jgi:hypothetical protein
MVLTQICFTGDAVVTDEQCKVRCLVDFEGKEIEP